MGKIKKKILLVLNPCAGRTKSRASAEEIIEKFSEEDYEFTVRNTTCQGDATNIVKNELDEHDMVVCCGGDGTLNETVNGVMDMARRVPIGYIPAGSTNDLATTLGIPKDITEATDLIKSGQLNDYDVGLFNNRYFTYVASFGAFTRSSYATSQKLKNKFGYLAYLPTAVPDAFDIKNYKLRIEHDGGVIEGDFIFGAISNSTSVGGFIDFDTNEIKLNDGSFELLLCKGLKMVEVIPTLLKVKQRKFDGNPLIFLHTKKLKVTALEGEVDWTLDGEYGGKHKNVMVHVLNGAVHIGSTENPLFEKHEIPEFTPARSHEQEAEEPKEKEKKFFKKRKAQKTEDAAEDAAEIAADENDAEPAVLSHEQEAEELRDKEKKFFKKRKAQKTEDAAEEAAENAEAAEEKDETTV
ncbi:MAG: diacylglycerol kinase family lipid kinase [Clostridia bacterium]|nr:diacylglycerol kinase family lipid kinase [Clostridia bacterium]